MKPARPGEKADRLGNEQDLLRRIQAQLHHPEGHIVTGIGDDCAVLAIPGAADHLIISSDLLIEHVHFEWQYQSPQQLGYKALAVNLSDLAAMGAKPLGVLVSLCAPEACTAYDVEQLYAGMEELARTVGTSIVGGDSSGSPQALMLSLTVLGLAPPNSIVRRSGAVPDDRLYVTGTLGDSAAGLEILKVHAGREQTGREGDDRSGIPAKAADELCRRHRLPPVRLAEGRWLAEHNFASAMLDLSDGLSTDLHRLCDASNVGACLDLASLPRSTALREASRLLQQAEGSYIFHGGEDYELLLSVAESRHGDLVKQWPFPQTPLTEIGRVTERQEGVRVRTSAHTTEPLGAGGFDHFAGYALRGRFGGCILHTPS